MPKLINLINYEIRTWKVISRDKNSKAKRSRWVCECKDCKITRTFDTGQIRQDECATCECQPYPRRDYSNRDNSSYQGINNSRFINMKDKKIGNWIVKSLVKIKINGGALWKCQCQKCYELKEISGIVLRKSKVIKCNCEIPTSKSYIGLRFGKLTVISEFLEKRKNDITKVDKKCLCKCDCGNEIVRLKGELKSDKKSSCKQKECRMQARGFDGDGYVSIVKPRHPNAHKNGRIKEHTYVMSEYLGRPLKQEEFVHHKNGIRNDNRIENLELWNKIHPIGARAEDLLKYAYEIIEKYKDYKNPTI